MKIHISLEMKSKILRKSIRVGVTILIQALLLKDDHTFDVKKWLLKIKNRAII